ncbi:MAG: hypothetical protein BWY85_00143 [Firmicutes bacterium ADurb.Bin506]|nr:MAG: hypothetical protein BWY85_00143 [Firmicutes bacterium ADurb.Bin506]
MPVLHQIIAVEKGTKNRVISAVTEIHKSNQKPELFAGQTRTYEPLTAEGQRLPEDNTIVQRQAPAVLRQVQKLLTEIFDVTAQRDYTNTVAKADVVVDGQTLLRGVPATYLLFLEKQLLDVRTLITELPTLDPAYSWQEDPNSRLFRSNPVQNVRTTKEESFVVVIQPTKEHPGKHEKVVKDVPQGTWTTVKLSGALPIPRKEELLERVERLMKAVKFAREEANGAEVITPASTGDAVFGYLFR